MTYKRGLFAAKSVYEGGTILLAVFLIVFVLARFLFFPTGIAHAANSEKSLLGLENNINYADRENTFPIEDYPLTVGDKICFASFSKGDNDIDMKGIDSQKRPTDCNSFVEFSCLCMFKGKNCETMVECADFHQFESIEIRKPSGKTRWIEGEGKLISLNIEKDSDDKLIITTG